MASKVLYKVSASHGLKKIPRGDQERIFRRIGATLEGNPTSGDHLHGEFAGLFKLRVGDYRVIYALLGDDALALWIRHRGQGLWLSGTGVRVRLYHGIPSGSRRARDEYVGA
ncbi:MAG: type II toxin-antitoxin system RelE/ParE family toxin [Nitrososphaerota archaeon]|nr:type II toxin-antitoxin system RelE/ParE family toxin [Nitrososphaerota archaeon]